MRKRRRVAIVGIGLEGISPVTPDVSYRELTYAAAVKAYTDAGVEPADIDSFIATSEDFMEGYSIADEYCPDQIGGVLKPCQTIPDSIQSLAVGSMLILTGQFEIVAVQAMSKASNIVNLNKVANFALDPALNRFFDINPHYVAALEMNRYMHETATSLEHCAEVVVKNKRNALINPQAGFAADITLDHVLEAEPICEPLGRLDIAPHADGAVVLVLASEDAARNLDGVPVWIEGVGWASDAPSLESRDWSNAPATTIAANRAYEMAGIRTPGKEINFAEIDDEYSFKELQHLEALGLCPRGAAKNFVEGGLTERGGALPVNVSGGKLGAGNLFDASGAYKLFEAALQLRGAAGARQVAGAEVGLVHAWRGVPSTSAAVAILSNRN
ncbi:MAG: hypothetical protein ABIH66_05455 [bacterium]